MMPTTDLITTLRKCANGLDPTIRFLVLDACDRLERKTKDNELLAHRIAELKSRTIKTNADCIRAMSDEELADLLNRVKKPCDYCQLAVVAGACTETLCDDAMLKWLKQPAEVEENA